jgi:hypothetical protein
LRNQTLLEITPGGNGELARDSDDHDARPAFRLGFGTTGSCLKLAQSRISLRRNKFVKNLGYT